MAGNSLPGNETVFFLNFFGGRCLRFVNGELGWLEINL